MRLIKLLIISVVIVASGMALYHNISRDAKHAIADWLNRLGSPDFSFALGSSPFPSQDQFINEYKNKGHKLTCYGDLRKVDKISEDVDYVCYTLIHSAYSGIPAKIATFFFSESKVSAIRIEFPETSFEKLHGFLDHKLAGYFRFDVQRPQHAEKENQSDQLIAWMVNDGVLATTGKKVPGENIILLWSRIEKAGQK